MIQLVSTSFINVDHLERLWQGKTELSDENAKKLKELEVMLEKLPNVTSEIKWDTVVMEEPTTTTELPVVTPHGVDREFLHQPPMQTVTTPSHQTGTGCSNLFFEHRDLVKELEKIICKAKRHSRHHKLERLEKADNKRNFIYLRDFHIARGRKQEVYFNPASSEIIMGLEGIKLMSLTDYIAWIKIQVKLLEVVLAVEETLRPFFNLRYHNFQNINPVYDNTHEVEVFSEPSSSMKVKN